MGTYYLWQENHNEEEEDSSPLLPPKGIRHIQQVVGSFLYYTRTIYINIHPVLNDIGSQKSKTTQSTNDDANILMNYLNNHPQMRYHKSDMQLHIDSDEVYMVSPRATSR